MSSLSRLGEKYYFNEYFNNPILISRDDAELKYKGRYVITDGQDYEDGLLRVVVIFKPMNEIPDNFPMEYWDSLTNADSTAYALLSFGVE